MPANFITLPRSQLYELVWTKPVTELAREFGISDVALAKRCRAINIPLSPRGNWAEIAAGQKPRRTPLPNFHAPREKSRTLRVPKHVATTAPASLPSYVSTHEVDGRPTEPTVAFAPRPEPQPAVAAAPISQEEAALRARIDAVDTMPAADLRAAHPAVLRTALKLKHLKAREMTFPRGERAGPVIEITNVSDAQLDRGLRVLDTLLRAAGRLDWPFEAPPKDAAQERRHSGRLPQYVPPTYGQLLVEGEPVTLRIDERRRRSVHVPTEKEKVDQKADLLGDFRSS